MVTVTAFFAVQRSGATLKKISFPVGGLPLLPSLPAVPELPGLAKPLPIPEIWRWCKEEPTAFKNVEISFENYPLVPGSTFNVIIHGDTDQILDELIVKTKITVGGLFSFMDVQRLCDETEAHCPLLPGPQVRKLTYHVPLAMFGTLTTTSIMYAGASPIACIKLGPLHTQNSLLGSLNHD